MRHNTVLFMPEGNILAHVTRCLEVARHVNPAEWDVAFACSGPATGIIDDAGFRRIPLFTREKGELLQRLHAGKSAFTYAILKQYVDAELRLLAAAKPRLIVSDFRPSLGISARIASVRHVCITNAIWTPWYVGPFDPPDSLLVTRILGKRLCRLLVPIAQRGVLRQYARPFNRLRREHGLRLQADVQTCMAEADGVLLADLPEFAPCSPLPSACRYVGPIVWEPDLPAPKGLNASSGDRKTAYVTLGSTGAGHALEAIVHRLAGAGYRVLCATGGRSLSGAPEGVLVTAFAPGRLMCRAADVVVCHGGNGTIYQALYEGKPVVGMPVFHDQEFNMQQVEALGAGVSVPARRATAENVLDCVESVLANDAFRASAESLRDRLAAWHGARDAAQWIDAFARDGKDGPEAASCTTRTTLS